VERRLGNSYAHNVETFHKNGLRVAHFEEEIYDGKELRMTKFHRT